MERGWWESSITSLVDIYDYRRTIEFRIREFGTLEDLMLAVSEQLQLKLAVSAKHFANASMVPLSST